MKINTKIEDAKTAFFSVVNLFFFTTKTARTTPSPARPQTIYKPSRTNIKYTRTTGQAYIETVTKEKKAITTEWDFDVKTGTGERTGELAPHDLQMLADNKNASEIKYRQIKSEWQKHKSSADIAKSLTALHGRGYSKRTIETYLALINKAKQEADAKIPQTAAVTYN